MDSSLSATPFPPRPRPGWLPPLWRPGLVWLMVLGPLFFLSYGYANQRAAGLPAVPSIVFGWERHIPLLPWTIVPYWSIDLFYALSLLVCRTRMELTRHGLRLLTAQAICVSCFLLFPLRFNTPRPPVDGWASALFDALASLDLPYNQSPSMHIVLTLILWDFYRRRLRGLARGVVHGWSALIVLSVLTTYQHHAIDIPTGLLAGALCLWLWPLDAPRPALWPWTRHPQRRRLALLYGGAALGVALMAGMGRAWWVLYWPAASLALVAVCYGGPGEAGFQKRAHGRHSLAVRLLMAPHRLGAWINARCWTRRLPASVQMEGAVWLGRLPLAWEPDHRRFAQLLDVTAELASHRHSGSHALGWLDLVDPEPAQLLAAAQWVQRAAGQGPVLVCCALGFSRSAAVVATWACLHGGCADVAQAAAKVRRVRPEVVMKPALLDAVERAVALGRKTA